MSPPPEAGRSLPSDGEAAGPRIWTVLDLLRWTTLHFERHGIETARLDAECLLAHALAVERLRLYIDFDKPVEEPTGQLQPNYAPRCMFLIISSRIQPEFECPLWVVSGPFD